MLFSRAWKPVKEKDDSVFKIRKELGLDLETIVGILDELRTTHLKESTGFESCGSIFLRDSVGVESCDPLHSSWGLRDLKAMLHTSQGVYGY